MATAETGATRVAVRVADCFLLAHDDFMRRTGQGRHVSQSIIELDRVPVERCGSNQLLERVECQAVVEGKDERAVDVAAELAVRRDVDDGVRVGSVK